MVVSRLTTEFVGIWNWIKFFFFFLVNICVARFKIIVGLNAITAKSNRPLLTSTYFICMCTV